MTGLSIPTHNKCRCWILVCFCWITLLWIGQAKAAEEYVVIQAQPQTDLLTAGKTFSLGDTINIPKNTVVTLLGEDGSVTRITGPIALEVTPDSIDRTRSRDLDARKDVSALSRISRFLLNSKSSESTVGGTRSVSGDLPDLWVIPIDNNAYGCFRDGVIGLFRVDVREDSTISVRLSDRSDSYRLFLKARQAVAYLPPGIAGGRLTADIIIEDNNTTIKLSEVPKSIDLSNKLQVLGWMIEAGCAKQAQNFLMELATKAKEMN